MNKLFFLLIGLCAAVAPAAEAAAKRIEAVRLMETVVLDGRLQEAVWQTPGYDDFVQRDPHDGAKPSESTRVWVAYDDRALYVAARLSDSDPKGIIGLLGRRDDLTDSDWFHFRIDPHFDRRSGYSFAVNPVGSLVDGVLYNDNWQDDTWDGIWEARTASDAEGWTVEMRIPFDQLRFREKEEYRWGVNFSRTIARKHETAVYAWRPKEENVQVSGFAVLDGVRGIRSGRGLELFPYVTSRLTLQPVSAGDPFTEKREFRGNGGLDLKHGLGGNITLDLTVNPDFGQVEVDPAEVNLTAFETFYSEKRPFFIEGAQTFSFGKGGATNYMGFDWDDPVFFYSRRIGRAPAGGVSGGEYVRFPGQTTILAAAKVSGKSGGWNFAALTAATAREYADVAEGERSWREEVEPSAWHGAVRLQKEFNEGRQGLGFIAASVLRRLRGGESRAEFARDAVTFGMDGWSFLGAKQAWTVSGWVGGSRIAGESGFISALQLSPQHYYQRPDVTHLDFDPRATSLNGWAGRVQLNKEKGRLLVNAAFGVMSPGFDSSETGFQFGRSDRLNAHVALGYNQPHPGKLLQSWSVLGAWARSYDFGGHLVNEEIFANAQVVLPNYWQAASMVDFYPGGFYSDTLTRGGPLVWMPRRTYMDLAVDSDVRRRFVVSAFASYAPDVLGNFSAKTSLSLRWKPASHLSFSVSPGFSWSESDAQWVGNFSDPSQTDTFGTRYVFAGLERRTASAEIRMNWIFSPRMSLQAYLQPYITVGAYDGFRELTDGRHRAFRTYGGSGSTIAKADGWYRVDADGAGPAPAFSFPDPDFNVKSLRGTVVFRYEYRPGSVFYLVWTQDRGDFSHPGDFRFGRDLSDLLSARGTNVIMLKFTHRLKL